MLTVSQKLKNELKRLMANLNMFLFMDVKSDIPNIPIPTFG